MAKATSEDEQASPPQEEQDNAPAAKVEPERPRRFTVSVLDEQKPTGAK